MIDVKALNTRNVPCTTCDYLVIYHLLNRVLNCCGIYCICFSISLFFFCLFWLQSSFGKLEKFKSQALDETKHNDKDKAACGNIIYIAYHYSFAETVFSSVSAYQLICSACALSLLSFIMMCNEQNVNTNHTDC